MSNVLQLILLNVFFVCYMFVSQLIPFDLVMVFS